MPKPDGSLSAVIVSGGKQYRVAPGDQILVDRIAAEPGSSVKLGRVLLFNDGNEIKVGNPAVDGLDVDAKVVAHRRGPRIESIRYKSKKRVRVHHGGRADLTALQIIAVGGIGVVAKPAEEADDAGAAQGAKGKPARKRVAPKKRASAKAEPSADVKAEKSETKKSETPKKTSGRKKESA